MFLPSSNVNNFVCHVFETYFSFILWQARSRKYWILPSCPNSKMCHPLLGLRSHVIPFHPFVYINPLSCFIQHHWFEKHSTEHKLVSLLYVWSIRVNMHCRGAACDKSFYMGLKSAEGRKLEYFQSMENNIWAGLFLSKLHQTAKSIEIKV